MIETAAPRTRNRSGTAALVLGCISLLLSLIACGVAGLSVDSNDIDLLPVQSKPEVASAAQVEAVAHVTLPPGSVLLTAGYSNGLETQLSAKVRMPRTELDAFVAAANFTTALAPGLRAVDAKHNVGGGNLWDPETAKTISGLDEEQPTAEGTRRALLVNLDAPDAVTVYLYASRG
ncbi:hypothetical protein PSH03_003797 [Micromonospora sp. PSH03]|uniref:hypothetical protein n=1 Tax=Micromonospora TaxID=1873 RepID=UPI001B36CB9F|nr:MULTISPECIES: hypothetical protein [Micromonospora]MBQ0994250.1 hypothetical protein [Micromonospora sp. H61]MCG5454637.1 hypothetical protein [Micromonospora salmantinae]